MLAATHVLANRPVDGVFIDGEDLSAGLARSSTWVSLGRMIPLRDSVSPPTRDVEQAASVRYTRERIAADPRFRDEPTVDALTFWT